jgi:hypothetical protein
MEGILLVKTDVIFKTGSSLSGRILAQTRADLQMATITVAPTSEQEFATEAVTSSPTVSPTTASPTTSPTVTTLAPTVTTNFTSNTTTPNSSASAPSAASHVFFLSALSALLLSAGVTLL